ncbi:MULTISPECIES: PhnD/SsuA/transferrin family substrate-binding protein [unclassified Facklamia]|uniref:phosphate/phosphite/phosphonate ABC transporter substrate-binding protein n=1 Tax=Aerococcaceae TaxID=186827 RepID=UPI0013BB321F|nr:MULTISPECIES: PhnD/SsuA/transferrin family substrate-binding protein [unclassified Facklamia]NEW63897.1 PhnD/SsuA/transferrin family substrate-binding protein [Facklamia sp. 252]NEW67368.1 PhnD/SsuA/transferrin family substrate-binding protein [Facklamia sp. 253]QQD65244.1 PhnD/SsuA/transferrin family substrate-binding protein [Aerococcaceae bacterium zg-252]
MTKVWRYVALLSLVATLFTGLFATKVSAEEEIETLRLMFVPSRDPEDIITTTEPLKQLLIDELAKLGFKVGAVDITVGTNYEAAGEALAAGTADAGFIPGGTFVLYEDEMEVILTSTRRGLNKDSENPADWNDGKPTERTEDQVTYYKGLIIAGPSAKGKELAAKINAGEKLTWEDLDSAKWAVMSSSSSSGYIYPSIWLGKQFEGKSLSDLSNVVQAESYGSAVARLAAEQVDVMVGYADLRSDNADDWTKDMGRKVSIWEETNVIGVTPNVYNDTISVSLASDIMTPEFKKAFQQALINISQTEEGKKVIAIYSHEGYKPASADDYETEREAQRILREQNNGN